MITPVSPVSGKPNLRLGAYEVASIAYRRRSSSSRGRRRRTRPASEADYTTRVVVLTPTDHAAFNGTVIVEWLNVSGGIDAPAVWFMAHREIAREGYAYVAVSAQRVGVEGGVEPRRRRHVAEGPGSRTVFATDPPRRRLRLRHLLAGRVDLQLGATACSAGWTRKPFWPLASRNRPRILTTYVNDVDPLARGLRRLPGPFPLRAARRSTDQRVSTRPAGRRRRPYRSGPSCGVPT